MLTSDTYVERPHFFFNLAKRFKLYDNTFQYSSKYQAIVKKNKKPTTESTTAIPFSTGSTTNTNVSKSEITQSSSPPIISSSPPSAETISQVNAEEHSSTDTAYSSSPSHHTGKIELDLEQNPAYPTLPDIITMNMNTDESELILEVMLIKAFLQKKSISRNREYCRC
ncbi:hypothetical protein WA026_014909 [Henosepilachna vigintioctopunctata]|uniref:Uncharacterized protein n=1 Tax=Henosepilachna vigintioctopunctata TaxID=420089 RepID=A0AAW1UYE9_9CUCU